MAMHNPPHPGEFIIQVYLDPNNLSGRELAGKLGVAASTLNRILTGLGACPTLTVLLRRMIRTHLRRSRPEKILNVFQRIPLRFFPACGLASGRASFASSRRQCWTGSLPYQPRNGTTSFQGAWPFSGELACHAVQSRSLASQAACATRQGRKSQAHSGLTGVSSRTG